MEVAVDLPPEARSVTRARRWALEAASAWRLPADLADRLACVVTELASNAVVHAHAAFRIRLRRERRVVRGEVSDADPHRPRVLNPAPRATAGRGLMLVQRLSERAGVDAGPRGKSVWFEFDEPV